MKKQMTYLVLAIFLSASFATADEIAVLKLDADGNLLWDLQHDSSGLEVGGLEPGPSDTFYAFHYMPEPGDPSLFRGDAAGNLLWDFVSDDSPQGMAVGPDGSAYLVGSDSEGGDGIEVVKVDQDGNEIWRKSYVEDGSSGLFFSALETDNEGNLVVAATSMTVIEGFVLVLLKYNESGDLIWTTRYDEGGDAHWVQYMALDIDGNILTAGKSMNTGNAEEYISTMKFSPDGELIWAKAYTPIFNLRAMEADDNGHVYLGGDTDRRDFTVIKYDSTGTFQWETHYGNLVTAMVRDLAADSLGNVLVGGPWDDHAEADHPIAFFTVVKLDPNGEFLWQWHYDAAPEDRVGGVEAMVVDSADNVYATGWACLRDPSDSTDFLAEECEYVTTKLTPDGVSEWVSTYSHGPEMKTDTGYWIVLTASGELLVAGSASEDDPHDDWDIDDDWNDDWDDDEGGDDDTDGTAADDDDDDGGCGC